MSAKIYSIETNGENRLSKEINLKSIIEQSFRLNFKEKERKIEKKIEVLNWKDTYENFWYPKLSISLKTKSLSLLKLKEGSLGSTKTTSTNPEGTLAFELGEYTLFNWNKEYLKLLNDKSSHNRALQNFNEKRRLLKHNVIIAFFKFVMSQENLKTQKKQLKHAAFIFRFNKERVKLKKISSEDYYQAKDLLLQAQERYQKAKVDHAISNNELIKISGESPNTLFKTKQLLLYKKWKNYFLKF